ncbi:MAG TPA: hypothetical protein VEO74_11675, partial [Thermoanaerobaculia bacterium]|nr:hypothetical protein [Thermoanaerobaculia bacterium]
MGLAEFADVALPVAVHGTFVYAIPPELRDDVRLGSRVEVPFGPQRSTGFVVALADDARGAKNVKAIRAVLDDDEPSLIPEILDLCRWAAEYYLAPIGEMLRVALPANMAARGRREVSLALDVWQGPPADMALIEELRRRPLTYAAAVEASSRSTVARLRDAGVVTIADHLRDAKGVRYDRFVVLEEEGAR